MDHYHNIACKKSQQDHSIQMTKSHSDRISCCQDPKPQKKERTDHGKRNIPPDGFLLYQDRRQDGTDSNNYHQIKNIGTYHIADRKLIVIDQ